MTRVFPELPPLILKTKLLFHLKFKCTYVPIASPYYFYFARRSLVRKLVAPDKIAISVRACEKPPNGQRIKIIGPANRKRGVPRYGLV